MQLGCFGFLTCFDGDSQKCGSCPQVKDCQQKASEPLFLIDAPSRSQLVVIKRHQKWAIKLNNKSIKVNTSKVRENFKVEGRSERVKSLSRNGKRVAITLLSNDVSIIKIVKNSSNIYEHLLPSYLSILLNCILKLSFSTRIMIEKLKVNLGWTESTSKTHVSAFLEVLVNWGFIERLKRGHYRIKS